MHGRTGDPPGPKYKIKNEKGGNAPFFYFNDGHTIGNMFVFRVRLSDLKEKRREVVGRNRWANKRRAAAK